MSRGGLEFRVGLTVVMAAVVLVVGTMWFQKFQLVEDRYSFFVRFPEVGGLVAGDPIVVNGVESGRVGTVNLLPKGVVVEMSVRTDVHVPDDSRIALKSIGIMGERFVAITRGTSPHALAPGDTTQGTFLMGLSEVMGAAGDILDEIAATSRNLKEILDVMNENGNLQTTMTNIADVSENLRQLTSETQPRLTSAIDRFDRVTSMMDSLVAGNYSALDSSLAAFGRTGPRLQLAVANMESVSTDLRKITDAVNEGHGTLGRLLNDEHMARRLESTIAGLDSLVADIRRHPGRYVSFKLF